MVSPNCACSLEYTTSANRSSPGIRHLTYPRVLQISIALSRVKSCWSWSFSDVALSEIPTTSWSRTCSSFMALKSHSLAISKSSDVCFDIFIGLLNTTMELKTFVNYIHHWDEIMVERRQYRIVSFRVLCWFS